MKRSNNLRLADLFRETAHYLSMENGGFRARAYERAARTLKDTAVDVSVLYEQGGLKKLEELPGIGSALALKIEEFLEKGEMEYLKKLRAREPLQLEEVIRVEGVGPKRAKTLYGELGVADLEDLEEAARTGRIASLEGFGEKSQSNILQAIEFLRSSRGRSLLGKIAPLAEELEEMIEGWPETDEVSVVGSIRRRCATVKDVDLLAGVSEEGYEEKAARIMEAFAGQPAVVKVWGRGETRSSVRLSAGFNADLRVVPSSSYGAALQYFTGSKDHNIVVRARAKRKGFKLNEYGLYEGEKRLAGRTEEEVYEKLGMPWIPPELRENRGEVEAALEEELPDLVVLDDIKGDLHTHSDWNGGRDSIETMARTAHSLGYEYLGVSDHTKFLRIENGLSEAEVRAQREEVDRLNERFDDFYILQGCEANIMKDGSLDVDDDCLAQLDYVVAGVHSHLKMGRAEMTARLLRAIKNPHVHIISHPTGRLLKQRDEYNIGFDRIIEGCLEYNVALEVNGAPVRLDPSVEKIRRAKEAGVKLVISSDAHHRGQLSQLGLGVGQARRGWVEKGNVLNTLSLKELLDFFKKRR